MRNCNRYLSQKNVEDIIFENSCDFPNPDLTNCFQGVWAQYVTRNVYLNLQAKLLDGKHSEKIIKISREKRQITEKWTIIRVTVDFSTTELRGTLSNAFEVLRDDHYYSIITFSENSFRNNIKTFTWM